MAVTPISEWTDAELRKLSETGSWISRGALAYEILRLRIEIIRLDSINNELKFQAGTYRDGYARHMTNCPVHAEDPVVRAKKAEQDHLKACIEQDASAYKSVLAELVRLKELREMDHARMTNMVKKLREQDTEILRMRPVADAALAWRTSEMNLSSRLIDAIDTYNKATP